MNEFFRMTKLIEMINYENERESEPYSSQNSNSITF